MLTPVSDQSLRTKVSIIQHTWYLFLQKSRVHQQDRPPVRYFYVGKFTERLSALEVGNTPYGKRHTSSTECVLVQAKYLRLKLTFIHSCIASISLKRTPVVFASHSRILVFLQPLTRITALRRSCFTERRVPSEA